MRTSIGILIAFGLGLFLGVVEAASPGDVVAGRRGREDRLEAQSSTVADEVVQPLRR